MALSKLGWLVIPLGLVVWVQVAREALAQPTALDRLRQTETAGKFKETDLSRGKVDISAAAPVRSDSTERPVLQRAALRPTVTATAGAVDLPVLKGEINQRLRELETCRGDAARTSAVTPEQIKTGPVLLRWTIVATGRTKNTAVLEEKVTSTPELLRCVRKRMDLWLFTPPTGGSVDLEYWYNFAPLEANRTAQADSAAKPAAVETGKAGR